MYKPTYASVGCCTLSEGAVILKTLAQSSLGARDLTVLLLKSFRVSFGSYLTRHSFSMILVLKFWL